MAKKSSTLSTFASATIVQKCRMQAVQDRLREWSKQRFHQEPLVHFGSDILLKIDIATSCDQMPRLSPHRCSRLPA